MSRNVRYRPEVTPTKKKTKKQVRKTYDSSSSDDDYAGVDLVSEEDEPDVEGAEEQAILEEEDSDEDLQITPRPTQEDDDGDDDDDDDEQESWNGFDQDSIQDPDILGDNVPYFDDHMARVQTPNHAAEATLWAGSDDEPIRKNVRFDISDSSDDDEDENYGFPDLFVPQEDLDKRFLRQIEEDDDQGSDSFWDFGGEKEGPEGQGMDDDSDDSSGTYSSGYESDEGETTDEESWGPIVKTAHPRAILRHQSTDSGAEEEITIARRAPPRTPGGPHLGVWTTTPDKPFAVVNNITRSLIMYKAKYPSSSRPHSSDGIVHSQMGTPGGMSASAMDGSQDMSPMISNSANLMMSAMYTSLDDFAGDHALGPPEAFFPFVDISANGHMTQDTPSYSGEDEDFDDDSGELWVEDFINFEPGTDDDGEGGDAGEADEDGSTTNDDSCPTPHPTTTTSEDQVHPMLFNPNLVGAFRSNQYRHRIMSRNNVTDNSLLFSGPLAHTAVRGIKDGRLAAATVPISPMRKQKIAQNKVHEASSPLAAQSKRKFSGEREQQMGHKRSKSMN